MSLFAGADGCCIFFQQELVAMVIKPLLVMITVSLGGWFGWTMGRPLGIMTAYFIAVAGASVGLYIGRRIQYHMDDD